MASYKVRHLESGEEFVRPWILINDVERSVQHATRQADPAVEAFHKTLPDYNETTLHSLPSVASELGLSHVFLKDESTRFSLPAFKILGASWAIHKALCERLGLPTSSSLDDVCQALASTKSSGNEVRLVTCSEGNWGRACARMSKILGLGSRIYVPGFMSEYTQELLRSEGTDVRVLQDGSYDDSIAMVRKDADATGAMMVMDTSWDGYEQVPAWVTDGYGTMLSETDRQVAGLTGGLKPSLFFVSVGVGSWAHSVVSHYKGADEKNCIVAVEPTVAASLKESLHCGQLSPIQTGETIMAGMCCGTTSKIAWPILQHGIHAAVTVTDQESHEGVKFLQSQNISAGPCGAATLAALRKYVGQMDAKERHNVVVVLFSTEGWREYQLPNSDAFEI